MSNYGVSAGQIAIGGLRASRDYAPEESSVTMMETKQKKKPGFIKRWLYKIAEESWNQKREEEIYSNKVAMKIARERDEQPSLNRDRAFRFNVYIANGGRIVEVSRYDRQKDRHVDAMYVITNEQDFGREIDKILTMEHLK